MSNFWQNLPKPFVCLAPMEDVTDFVFRELVANFLPRPDVFFTEFTSADGLCSKGKDKILERLKYSQKQTPIVAQIWGTKPETIHKAAKICSELKFDGIDINMGCPVRAVVKKGAGSGHINNPNLAAEIISAAKKGAKNLPVSVKTRIGFNKIQTEEWIGFLLKQNLNALTIHGRIAKEMSKYPANWEEIQKAVKLRDQFSPKTLIIGNGDVNNKQDSLKKAGKYGVDGTMIARGIFANPWAFESEPKIHDKKEHLQALTNHLDLHKSFYGNTKNYNHLKKFFKMYIANWDGAKETRVTFMNTTTVDEARNVINITSQDHLRMR